MDLQPSAFPTWSEESASLSGTAGVTSRCSHLQFSHICVFNVAIPLVWWDAIILVFGVAMVICLLYLFLHVSVECVKTIVAAVFVFVLAALVGSGLTFESEFCLHVKEFLRTRGYINETRSYITVID